MIKKLIVLAFLILSLLLLIHPTLGCTIVSQQVGDTVLFGNNEDYKLKNTMIGFVPAQSSSYGYMYLGFNLNNDSADGYPQGTLNNQGLACDGNGLPAAFLNPNVDKPSVGNLMSRVMRECATVNDTIEWCRNHNFGRSMSYQLHFADATGDSVVVSAGSDQRLAFTRKNGSSYLISTNFNLANSANGYYPCDRYNTAKMMLDDIEGNEKLSIEDFRDILDAVHIEGQYATKYSNIFNLKTLEVYLYQNHDFSQYIRLNLTEELLKGAREYKINELFEPESIQTSSTTSLLNHSSTSYIDGIYCLIPFFILFLIKRRKLLD